MATLEALQQLYEEYKVTATQVRKKASAFAGVFGLGDDPRRNSCHDRFYEAVGLWAKEFLATQPSGAECAQVVRYMLEAAHLNRNTESYWYLYAAQGYCCDMIPLLEQEDCRQILERFCDIYPKQDRLPVQRELVKLLQQHLGRKVKKPGLLQKIFG